MLVGSKEWLELQNKSRTKIAGEGIKGTPTDIDEIWVKGKYIKVVDSFALMSHIKTESHETVLRVIKEKFTEAENFFKSYPEKRPPDYYVVIEKNHAVLDQVRASGIVEHFTGNIPDFDFIEKDAE